MRTPALLAALTVLVSTRAARADDCPMDFTAAAGGTWSTYVAEVLDACMADPACAAAQSQDPDATERMLRPPPTRSPRGTFARGSAMVGARARGLYGGGPAAGDAHVMIAATGEVGWHRGVRACGRTAIDAGERTDGRSAFGVAVPLGFWSVAMNFEQDWQVQPALSSPRQWLRRAYTANRMTIGFATATWRRRDGGAGAALPVRVTMDWRGQEEAMADTRVLQSMRGSLYESVGATTRVQVVPWQMHTTVPMNPPDPATPGEVAIDPSMPPAATPSHWIGRVGVLALEHELAGAVRVELAADAVFSSRRLDCRGCQPFAGTIGVDVAAGDDRWQLRAERTPYLAVDDVVTLEDRVSAGYQRPRARHTLRASGFAAATRTTDGSRTAADDEVTFTGGAALALELPVGQGFTLTGELEVARSFYARLDGDVAPVAEPGGRASVMLARRFGRAAGAAH